MISQLLTPEEPLADSFMRPVPMAAPFRPVAPSTPESPALHSFSSDAAFAHSDDVLYPDHNNTDISHDKPLFGPILNPGWASPRRHRSPELDGADDNVPSPHDSRLSVSPRPLIKAAPQADAVGPVALNNKFGWEYYRHCLAQLEEDRARLHRTLPTVHHQSRAAGRDRYSQQQVSSLGRSSRIEKTRSRQPHQAPIKFKATVATSPVATTATAVPMLRSESSQSIVKRTRRQATTPDAFASAAPFHQVPAPKPRTRAAPSKRVDDKDASDWADLPDYCPPVSSLATMNKKLHAAWTNANALDLSSDPDRAQLHPQEIEVASVLRLRCNQYLSNKRRIFAAKVELMRANKDFNKTSAQTCCKIDVNKASKLWQAFKDIGWLEDHWFQQYL